MKQYNYYGEIHDMLTQFMSAFSNIKIKRFDNAGNVTNSFLSTFIYGPKERIIHDLTNPSQTIKLPVVAVNISNISVDKERIENDFLGSVYRINDSNEVASIPQPAPINIDINMSIMTRYQSDMDQIYSHFIPHAKQYFYIVWKVPIYGLQIKSKVSWSGSMNSKYPTDLPSSTPFRITADTSFTIEGWLFKGLGDPTSTIHKIDSEYTPTTTIWGYGPDYPYKDAFHINARPKLINAFPASIDSESSVQVYGKFLEHTTKAFVSSIDPDVFLGETVQDHFDDHILYPPFNGLETLFQIEGDLLTVDIPLNNAEGKFDIILLNDAGYGKLTVDSIIDYPNPYPENHPDHDQYRPPILPIQSGIKVSSPPTP